MDTYVKPNCVEQLITFKDFTALGKKTTYKDKACTHCNSN